MDRKSYFGGLIALAGIVTMLFVVFGRGSAIGGTYQAVIVYHVGLALLVRALLNDIGLPSQVVALIILACGVLWLSLIHILHTTLFGANYPILLSILGTISLVPPILIAVAALFPRRDWWTDRQRPVQNANSSPSPY
ncbi:MAG: hypothetical protein BGP04_08140 [Rhizobiales bacterium 62-17]|nr:hypothetical protein [Hyphomicrobiales bacterium]OJY05361.1 MAG: hypothetical protein BGP04_08140 [Rhizobiales bacterium 62-17]